MKGLNIINEDSIFQSYMSAEEDDRKMLNTYKDKAEKAYSKGIEQGIQQGIEQGIQQGIEQNKKENCNALYKNGVDIEIIAVSLLLSIDEVKEILSK